MSKSNSLLKYFDSKYPDSPKYRQSFSKYLPYLESVLNSSDLYKKNLILERLIIPERSIKFRINWVDDKGKVRVNRGYRVQMNSNLGPYKGGLRFNKDVDEDTFMFLAFKQIFKNCLTGLPLGAGKGGADLDPKNLSDNEMMQFCQSFMLEMHRYIGQLTDVPAGDMGVGSREIGYMYAYYRKINNVFTGTMTGKSVENGGSKLRTEATGYGLIYFVNAMLEKMGEDWKDKKCLLSGAGNVSLHAAEKILEFKGKVLSLSDSGGVIYSKKGFTKKDLEKIKKQKLVEKLSLEKIAASGDFEYKKGKKPWDFEADIALPCATENELDESDAKKLIENGIRIVAEGANMPCSSEAIDLFQKKKVLFVPDIAANTGGVYVSGLEITQNATFQNWGTKKVDKLLKETMENIHEKCISEGQEKNYVNYEKGAIKYAFKRIAESMLNDGVV
ncbi:MAG: NADP-specific glutamate dehydrogenase [Chitinophagaceae bacterium]|nr:MAG: NADP-specific glutamate dehydrogenase [Chitinophagaceae bacterium]